MKQKLICITILLGAYFASTTVLLAETFYQVTKVAKDDSLNVRESANYRTRKVGEIPHNGICIKRSKCVGNWCQIEHENFSGWVHGKYLKKMPDAARCLATIAMPGEIIPEPKIEAKTVPPDATALPQPPQAVIDIPASEPAEPEKPETAVETKPDTSEKADKVSTSEDAPAQTGGDTAIDEQLEERPAANSAPNAASQAQEIMPLPEESTGLNRSQLMIQITRTLCSKKLLTADDPVITFIESANGLFDDHKAIVANDNRKTGDPLVQIKAYSEHGRVFADYYGEQDGVTRCGVTMIPFENVNTIRFDDIDRRIELAMRMSGRSLVANVENEEMLGTLGSPVRTITKYYGSNCDEINIKTSQSSVRDITRVSTITLALTGNLPAPASGCDDTSDR